MHVKHISISLLGKKVKNRKLDSVVFVIWYSPNSQHLAQSQEQLVTVTAFFIVPALLTVTTLVTGTTLIKVTSLVPVLTLFAFITHHK